MLGVETTQNLTSHLDNHHSTVARSQRRTREVLVSLATSAARLQVVGEKRPGARADGQWRISRGTGPRSYTPVGAEWRSGSNG
jgi:hypothetical protein